MHIDAKAVAQHAERIANTAFAIERIADRKRMNEVTLGCERLLGTGSQYAANIGLLDFMAAQINACREGFALEATG